MSRKSVGKKYNKNVLFFLVLSLVAASYVIFTFFNGDSSLKTILFPQAAGSITLIAPTNGSVYDKELLYADFSKDEGAGLYYAQISQDNRFLDIYWDGDWDSVSGSVDEKYEMSYLISPKKLKPNTTYYWRVRRQSVTGSYTLNPGPWSPVFSFTTASTLKAPNPFSSFRVDESVQLYGKSLVDHVYFHVFGPNTVLGENKHTPAFCDSQLYNYDSNGEVLSGVYLMKSNTTTQFNYLDMHFNNTATVFKFNCANIDLAGNLYSGETSETMALNRQPVLIFPVQNSQVPAGEVFTWLKVSNADLYTLEYSFDGAKFSTLVQLRNTYSYRPTKILSATTRNLYWRVIAKNTKTGSTFVSPTAKFNYCVDRSCATQTRKIDFDLGNPQNLRPAVTVK